jgi:hypothetical protein
MYFSTLFLAIMEISKNIITVPLDNERIKIKTTASIIPDDGGSTHL